MGGLGMGGGGIPIPASVGGGGALLIVVAIIVLNLLASSGSGGGGLGSVLNQLGGGGRSGRSARPDLTNNGDEVEFMGYVLDDANDLWAGVFRDAGETYQPTKLVLFDGRHAVGLRPGELGDRARSTARPTRRSTSTSTSSPSCATGSARQGDFAEAYVVAHEVGHHVQQQTGIEAQVRAAPGSRTRAARTSCR